MPIPVITEFINRGITPYVPEHGSVGASGDLVQLAHIALTLIGEGEVLYQGKKRDTASVLAAISFIMTDAPTAQCISWRA